MSTRKCVWMAVTPVVALAFAAVASGQSGAARLATFNKDGQAYFALSVTPNLKADPAQKNAVVILVDTSASQAGKYRDEELAALGSLLAGLRPNDRVQLMAVDLNAVPMDEGFVAPTGAPMQAAISKLVARAPLGATDLEAGLRAAAGKFAADGSARTVIYIGDAMSKAGVFSEASLRKLVGDLRNENVSVSGFVTGQEPNVQLMAAFANHTGGIVQVSDRAADAAAAGRALAASIHASVIWPKDIALSDNVSASYPAMMPPLRTDRDSILIGTLARSGDVNLEVVGTMNDQSVKVAWKATPEKSSEDFAFLPKLIDLAKTDQGLSLPTVGSPGLRQAAVVTLASAQQLAKLGHEALASGNVAGAAKVANAALARDPGNPEAQALKEAARKAEASRKTRPTSEPDLKLSGFTEGDKPAGSLLEEVLAEEPGFLGKVTEEQQVIAGKVRAEVEKDLSDARRAMGENPQQAEQNLKLTLERIESSANLEPEVRSQLRQQVENAIRQTRRVAVEVADRKAGEEERQATAKELERITRDLDTQQQRLKQVMERFDSLMDEGRYQLAADDVAPEVQRLAPGSSIASSVIHGGQIQRMQHENTALLQMRDKSYLLTLHQVELAAVPFPDEPPVIYISPDKWEDLTLRRQKYKAVDLGKQGSSEQKIFEALSKTTDMEFIEQPLKEAVDFLSAQHRIPIVLAAKKLEEAGVNPDTPITKNLHGITLRSALRLMLKELELTYAVRDEVLQITTPEDAESKLITKVYPVGDLVVPIGNSGIGGLGGMGMMGGMGGGMMGGMGGGMGGMGGGMMGGMGGMGGGMGGMGGMFAVEDDLTLGTKKVQPAPPAVAAAPQPEVRRPSAKNSPPAQRIVVQPAAGESLDSAWDRYFAAAEERLSAASDPAAGLIELLASVRETVRQLMHERKYSEVPVLIQAALRHGHLESWMYEAMALAMQVEGAKSEDLERALLSAVDFAQDEDQVLIAATYMAQFGLHKRALKLYQQIAAANPSRPEPYIQGLALAQRLEDAEGIKWACVGVLSQASTGAQRAIGENAYRVGLATYNRLLDSGRKAEAAAFEAAARHAQERDCKVVVTWTGDADIDLSVEEPSGTVVSQREPRSTSGGVHLGDVSSADAKGTASGFSETYVCPEGFSGQYRALIKSVWGRPTSGRVTVDVYTHYGSGKQDLMHGQIELVANNAMVVFELKDGRRKEALAEAQVANVAKVQNAANRAILAQQLAGSSNSGVAQSFAEALAAANVAGLGPGAFFRRGAVGYRPVITQLPEGALFSSNAVISADRRYVRVSPSPFFSQITEVNTFNFVTGQGATQGAGQGGVAGGGGGGAGIGGGGGFF